MDERGQNIVFLDALPLTPIGKPDRQALPEPDYTCPALANPFVAPRTPDESRLADIWAQTLGLDRVGMYDNFFELGGNSLLAGKILTVVKQAFGLDVPMGVLFQSPTIASFAEKITSLRREPAALWLALRVSRRSDD